VLINDVTMRDYQRRSLQWFARQDLGALDARRAVF